MPKGLTNRYYHSLDAKGRVIMPAKFRERLGEKIWITSGLEGGCLYVYPNDEWERIESQFQELPTLTNKDARRFQRYFFSNADDRDIDKQGRVLIPPLLREQAGLEDEVVLVGVFDHIEIWSKDRWQEQADVCAEDMDELTGHMAELGFNI